MSDGLPVDSLALREEVKSKYRAVAVDPRGRYPFHTGRPLARRLTPSAAPAARARHGCLKCLVTPFWHTN